VLNASVLSSTTDFLDTTLDPAVTNTYTVRAVRTAGQHIAWQNVGYNQPPHPGCFLGHGMRPAARPHIVVPPP